MQSVVKYHDHYAHMVEEWIREAAFDWLQADSRSGLFPAR
jgi:hypothetical protein